MGAAVRGFASEAKNDAKDEATQASEARKAEHEDAKVQGSHAYMWTSQNKHMHPVWKHPNFDKSLETWVKMMIWFCFNNPAKKQASKTKKHAFFASWYAHAHNYLLIQFSSK